MRTLLLGIGIAFTTLLHAQRNCASTEYADLQRSLNPQLSLKTAEIEEFIQAQAPLLAKEEGENVTVIRIPVVVHVLYNTSTQNISDAQIYSQIEALNRDFRRRNGDTANTPFRFKGIAADVQIEFALATADPDGRPTTGIIRKKTNVPHWTTDDKVKRSLEGGDDAWDRNTYLNIWVANLRSLLGYSSVLGCSPEVDGVVIHYGAFGTINTAAPYHMGRTAVHEVGHWLGLKHIWGDTYCGDDKVDDTPQQGNFTPGCPTSFRSSCSNGSMGDMYMNYMDYTDDACVNLFTVGQKQRMLSLFNPGGPRYALLSSKGLAAPWKEPIVEEPSQPDGVQHQITAYPNPVAKELSLNVDENWIGQTVQVVNLNGVVVNQIRITSRTTRVDLSRLSPGVYFLQGNNGTGRISHKLVKL